ncbi:uncharacterized protein F5891DRAFT_1180568 [Suillus fuscotomentosus]|uniref:Uncharacterized protein n=1 Tax=Suillus fuscotomentosus TaxID=1912939 RepID=A0AAD4HSN0_9AGAM|nr:uncharacterized protein F5891DRAFT_1180568 [Suillus fuscotomentosus]KAG1907558.1 hypothetical protein F5891DRAFT_1180568 [Suillus fuscotomentosus]
MGYDNVSKSVFKSHSGGHYHIIELVKTEPRKKAHTYSHCKPIMYPSSKNLEYNHRQDPQPSGIFSEGKHFHSCAFLETVKQIYKQIFLWPSGKSPALEQEAFMMILLDQSMTLKSETFLFKLYEELKIDKIILDVLLTVHNNVKCLHIEYLQEH